VQGQSRILYESPIAGSVVSPVTVQGQSRIKYQTTVNPGVSVSGQSRVVIEQNVAPVQVQGQSRVRIQTIAQPTQIPQMYPV
jgi:hypothetical protein